MRRISGEFMAVATIPRRIYIGYVGERLSINSNLIEEGKIAADYRFKSRNQMHRLLTCWPVEFVTAMQSKLGESRRQICRNR
jgi:hypothetical protein